MAIKIIIDASILINIYWNRLFIRDQFQLFQQFLKLDNTEYKKNAMWNLIFVTTGSMCEQMDMSEGRYIFQFKIW